MGGVLEARGDLTGALAAFKVYRDISRGLVAHDGGRWDWQRDLAVAESRVGDVLQARGDRAGALAAFEVSRDISCRLVAHDGGRWEWQRGLALAWWRIGCVHDAQGNLDNVRHAWSRVRECQRIAAQLAPQSSSLRDELRSLEQELAALGAS